MSQVEQKPTKSVRLHISWLHYWDKREKDRDRVREREMGTRMCECNEIVLCAAGERILEGEAKKKGFDIYVARATV